jgi:hypothetical protein
MCGAACGCSWSGEGIFHLEGQVEAKDWRPHPLVLSGAPTRRWNLIEFAAALTHGRGLITVSTVLPEPHDDPARQARMERTIRDYLQKRGVRALVRLIAAADPFEGGERLVEVVRTRTSRPQHHHPGRQRDAVPPRRLLPHDQHLPPCPSQRRHRAR